MARALPWLCLLLSVLAWAEPEPDVAPEEPLPVDQALDVNRLWLPKSSQKHWPKLRQAAETVLATERCIEVVRGELLLEQSRAGVPWFGIVCRDARRRTYLEKINGETLAMVHLLRDPPNVDKAMAELEALLAQAQISVEQQIYQQCRTQWQAGTKLMQQLKWLDALDDWHANEQATQEDGSTRFRYWRAFDAVDMFDRPLHYLAECQASSVEDLEAGIAPRR